MAFNQDIFLDIGLYLVWNTGTDDARMTGSNLTAAL